MSVTVDNSIVENGWATGSGILDQDPLFVTSVDPSNAPTTSGNLRLQSSSPAINTGNNSNIGTDSTDIDEDGNTSETVPLDLDGNVRIHNTTVDMGAYEYGSSSPSTIATQTAEAQATETASAQQTADAIATQTAFAQQTVDAQQTADAIATQTAIAQQTIDANETAMAQTTEAQQTADAIATQTAIAQQTVDANETAMAETAEAQQTIDASETATAQTAEA